MSFLQQGRRIIATWSFWCPKVKTKNGTFLFIEEKISLDKKWKNSTN